jgi:hypothetical protein
MRPDDYDVLLLALVAFAAILAILFFKRWMLDALLEAIERFRGGGPPTPMHPSPAGDDALLRRRRVSASSSK